MSKEKPETTYRDLLNHLSNLTDDQLNQPTRIMIVDNPNVYNLKLPEPMGEDIYVNKDDFEDGGPLSELQEQEDFDIENYRPGLRKDDLIFCVDPSEY